ncbi:carboxypeptidase M32 [Microvirga makkahensis]|uniref:Uncharacterized protein n=1 Tax=Microvirga makkahensis TaxID=1128670 RepID=A0A7X3MS34_9HYPH|nr:carboxypeptidase M32 [Microvirga makkahensis]MXQ12218.1 hypothetical protein [Microvirga makkahensis]
MRTSLRLAIGDFAPLRTWLRTNVHVKGSLMTADELLATATGQPLTAEDFRVHPRERSLAHGGLCPMCADPCFRGTGFDLRASGRRKV